MCIVYVLVHNIYKRQLHYTLIRMKRTNITLEEKHREIAERHGINISKFTRKKLEELER